MNNISNDNEFKDAYAVYDKIGIKFPRFRDCWLAKDRKQITENELKEELKDSEETELRYCIQSGWAMNPTEFMCSFTTDKKFHKLSGKKDFWNTDKKCHIKWNLIHGKKRKVLKYAIKCKHKRIIDNYNMHNRFAGKDNVLVVYTRLGASNWNGWKCYEYEKQPWFLGKIDDSFDCTYCTIFIDLNKI